MQAILIKKFYHDGRGPELQKAYHNDKGTELLAVDFFNPDDKYSEENLKHVLFIKPQAFMVTPEEEYNYVTTPCDYSKTNKGAIIDLGKSSWYQNFSNRHSAKSSHFQLMFYDEYIDIICENIEIKPGSFAKKIKMHFT